MKYRVWSFEHNGWWKQNRHGYTLQRDEAGQFSFDEAFEITVEANAFDGNNVPPSESMVPVC